MCARAADGYGRGEGFAVLLLELVGGEGARGVRALLAGSAVNQDGRSSGLAAPNGPSQTKLLEAAVAEAGGAHLRTVATHGTGILSPLVTPCLLSSSPLFHPSSLASHFNRTHQSTSIISFPPPSSLRELLLLPCGPLACIHAHLVRERVISTSAPPLHP